MEIWHDYGAEETALKENVIPGQVFSGEPIMSGEKENVDSEQEEGRSRSTKKDRSSSRYSEEAFLNLPREEQLALAERYWNGPVADFDDGTFQFSYAHFGKICERIGFRKGIVDTMPDPKNQQMGSSGSGSVIYIDHGRRESMTKKFTISRETNRKIERLLGDKLSNIEKSKVLDIIFSQALDQKLLDLDEGRFGVAYRPCEEVRLI